VLADAAASADNAADTVTLTGSYYRVGYRSSGTVPSTDQAVVLDRLLQDFTTADTPKSVTINESVDGA